MTLEAKATILAVLAVGLAFVFQVWPRSRTSIDANVARGFPVMLAVALVTVALALIVVGVVSGTLRTHLVQIAPLVTAPCTSPGETGSHTRGGRSRAVVVARHDGRNMALLVGAVAVPYGKVFAEGGSPDACYWWGLSSRAISDRPSRNHAAHDEAFDDRACSGPAVSGAMAKLSANRHW
jgi:hypothetical protein